jgi:hypothetical protein
MEVGAVHPLGRKSGRREGKRSKHFVRAEKAFKAVKVKKMNAKMRVRREK